MATIILALATLFFAVNYLIQWVSVRAMVAWVLKKGYTPPTDREMSECTTFVWKKLLHMK